MGIDGVNQVNQVFKFKVIIRLIYLLFVIACKLGLMLFFLMNRRLMTPLRCLGPPALG
jgi:hypothetical protein